MSSAVTKQQYSYSGAVKFSDLRRDFAESSSGSIPFSTYYRATSLSNTNPIVPDATENTHVPTSSTIAMSAFKNNTTVKRYYVTQSGTDSQLAIHGLSWNGNLDKNIIKEFRGAWDKGGPAWSGKTYEFISDYMIPLSPSVIKRTIGDINVSSFHVTTLDGLKTLKSKLVGSQKSISTFRGVGEDNSILQGMGGIQNDGGIIVYVEGTLLSNGIEDISSRPDESGRRWITNFSFNDMYYPVSIYKSDIHKWFLKTPVIKEILKEWKEDVKNKKYPSALKGIGNIPSEKDLFDVIKWRLSQGLKGASKKEKLKS